MVNGGDPVFVREPGDGFWGSSYQSSVSFHDDSYKMALPHNNALSCLFCAVFHMLFFEI